MQKDVIQFTYLKKGHIIENEITRTDSRFPSNLIELISKLATNPDFSKFWNKKYEQYDIHTENFVFTTYDFMEFSVRIKNMGAQDRNMTFTVEGMTFTAHKLKDITEMELGFCAGSVAAELSPCFIEDHYATDIEGVFFVEAQCGRKWFGFETLDFEHFELI